MRKIFILIILIINFSSVAFAECNFQLINFGESKQTLGKKIKRIINIDEFELISTPDQFGGEIFMMPLGEICRDEQEIIGTMIEYLFINEKLERVQLVRANMPDKNLMKYSMEQYGEFSLQEGLPIEQWKGNHYWEKGKLLIEYVSTNIQAGNIEVLSIQRIKDTIAMSRYLERLGKWLDTGN